MKLQQNQVWKRGGEFIRIVRLERARVEYKSQLSLANKDGTHHAATKKEFCKLLKEAILLTTDDIKAEQFNTSLDPGAIKDRKTAGEENHKDAKAQRGKEG